MSSAAQAPTSPKSVPAASPPQWRVLVPYLVAIVAQFPMLFLYYRNLTSQPHYQPFAIAIIATIAIAVMRWPFGKSKPFRQSLASDILLFLALGSAVVGALFVEPWFAALGVMLTVTSLLARTSDREAYGTLWSCSLPLYVYLSLPMGLDVRLITSLQYYSAVYTSRLLDLAGLGHHMNGTVIKVPDLKEYGIEQACSGVQSFFTLLLVAVVFCVLSRRVKTPHIGVSILSMLFAFVLAAIRMIPGVEGVIDTGLLILAVGFVLYSFLGFRAAVLILSAVFWAVFMNTIRILTIPLAENFFDISLAEGIGHTTLGYFALGLGIVMLMSTDQFLLFMFGPVEESSDSGSFGKLLSQMWNSLSKKTETEEEKDRRRKRRGRPARMSPMAGKMLWVFMGAVVLMGVWQLVDVQRSIARADKGVRFFDADVTVEFSQDDMPEEINRWKRVKYVLQDRARGSDLGERSDVWQFRSPAGVQAVASLDQTFPGWHELTTCYRNTGWVLTKRKPMTPEMAVKLDPSSEEAATVEIPGSEDWDLIEATFEKPTGEKGYLVFAHFDSFGEGLDVPSDWGTITSFFTRAANRLSHRIRARLLRGEAYQVQVFLTSYDEFDPVLRLEVRQRFLKIREQIRERFLEKLAKEAE